MVVPVFFGHEGGNAKAQDARADCNHLFAALEGVGDPLVNCVHAKAYPDGKHVEGPGVGVIPFTHLVRRLVEVQHNGYARHEEHEEHYPAASLVFVELEHQAQEAKQERQEEVVVLALVFPERSRGVTLVSKPYGIQEAYAAFPVAVKDIAGNGAVDVVLAPHEVPHEVAPVHPVELIVKEVRKVCAEGGLAGFGAADPGSLAAGVHLVELHVTGVCRRPHPGEEHLAFRLVNGLRGGFGLDVLPVHGSPVGGVVKVIWSVPVLAVKKRRGAVLLTAEVTHKGVGVVRLVLVGGRFHAGADNHYGEQAEAHDQCGHAKQNRVPEYPALLEGCKESPEAKGQKGHHEKQGAAVVRQAEAVHKQAVHPCRNLRKVRDEDVNQEELYHNAYEEDADELFGGQFLVLVHAVIVHEHKGGDGKEVQKVNAD